VNGRKPHDDEGAAISMDDWLAAGLPVDSPDLYAIGFQELDLSKEAFIRNNSSHEDIWTPPIESALATKGEYTKLHSKQLVGTCML
jgi:phosphatidylinositol-bisphosphatase